MKFDGHLSKNICVEGVLINVITPLTIRAVLNDIKNAKITILYCLGSFFILFALPRKNICFMEEAASWAMAI